MSTSAILSLVALVLYAVALLSLAVEYARGRDRTVLSHLAPLLVAGVMLSVGDLFLSGPSAITASILSILVSLVASVRIVRWIRRSRTTTPVVGRPR